jgi:hypothetical protein
MFNWFRNLFPRPEYNDIKPYEIPMVKAPETKPIPPIPNIPSNQVKDHYRIGYDSINGATTLTLHADYTSMTLSLPPEEVMRLIRMLGATLDDEDIIGGSHDGDFEEDDE